ncbi:hypothetical protein FRC01_005341 [Tulasnella sp. 417]|nr:hypothetical protein FRC01_005341 [Tulasnella sp. 417]
MLLDLHQRLPQKTKVRAGQDIFLNCPAFTYFQWHPPTSSAAPEEDCISVHIRIAGNFTGALVKVLGRDFDGEKCDDEKGGKNEAALLPCIGIGGTPFGSILKSIWYRINNMNNPKTTRSSKVNSWVICDSGSAEWSHSMLDATQEQGVGARVEISIYLTAKLKDGDVNNTVVRGIVAENV